MDLVLQLHVVNAGLRLELAGLDAEAALDVVRGLGLQPEIAGNGNEVRVESRARSDTLIDVRRAERACRTGKYREYVGEAMLDADMQRVLRFVAVEWKRPGTEDEWRRAVEAITGAEADVLGTGSVGEVRRRQQANGLLPVTGERLLRQVVDVPRGKAPERASVLMERGIVIVDAGKDCRRNPEDRVPDAQSRRDRPCLEVGVVEGRRKARQWRRKRYRAEESALRVLLPHAAVDDQVDTFDDRLGEARGGAGALLVAVVEGRGSAPAIGDQFVDADRGVDNSATRQAELLVVAGHRQERLEVGRGVIEVADAVLLVEGVVLAIAVRFDGVAVERGRPRTVVRRGGNVGQTLVEGADAGLAANRHRRAADPALGDDVDHAADGIVAIEHRAAVAARDLDALDRVERDGRQIDLRHVDVVQPAAVDQDQGVGGGEGAEAAQVDGGLRAIHGTSEQRGELHARRLCQYVGQVVRRRVCDLFCRDYRGGSADNAIELAHTRAGAAAVAGARTVRRPGAGAARGRPRSHRPRRAAALVECRPCARLVLVGRRGDLDRRQFVGGHILRMRCAGIEGKKRGGEKDRATPGGGGGGRHGSDLGMTSVARHSERRPTIAKSFGKANVCTPRPTSSRVTTADGRSPGSRVVTLRRLPRTEISQWHMTKDSPHTVAGAATASGKSPSPHSLLIPKSGNRHIHLRLRRNRSQCHLSSGKRRYALCSRRLVPGRNHCE